MILTKPIVNTAGISVFLCLALAAFGSLGISQSAQAGMLPIGVENRGWSDMAFPSGVSGSFTAGTMTFVTSASPSNNLELGGEFGGPPPNPQANHYGSSGIHGLGFNATLNVTGVKIAPDGTVSNGGSVSIVHNGSSAGSIKDDYAFTNGGVALPAGHVLLSGAVLEVLLDATGANTLDVLFSISGGALQSVNPLVGVNFSPDNLGILRFGGSALVLPVDFSGDFSFGGTGVTINVLGLPEPSSVGMGLMGIAMALSGARRSRRATIC